jgi:hypothetical protein
MQADARTPGSGTHSGAKEGFPDRLIGRRR